MTREKFLSDLLNKSDVDYGICPPPISAKDGLMILINHFLGDDWCTIMSISQEQVYTEAIYAILDEYKGRKIAKH